MGNSVSFGLAFLAVIGIAISVYSASWDMLLAVFAAHRALIIVELLGRIRHQFGRVVGLVSINLLGIVGAFVAWWFQAPILFTISYSLFWGLTLWFTRKMMKPSSFPSSL